MSSAAARYGFGSALRYGLRGQESAICAARSVEVPKEMKSVVQVGYGTVEESLDFARVPVSPITAHDVLIRVKAASLNQIDCKLRYGLGRTVLNASCMKGSNDPMKGPPFIVGRDFSGEIVQVGSAVPDLPHYNAGQSVLGLVDQLTAQGTWAEYVRVPYWHVARKPDYLSHEEAASLPFSITGATNLLKLFAHDVAEKENLKKDVILVGGSTGGSVAYNLAVMLQAMEIEPTCFIRGSDDSLLRALGIDNVEPFDGVKLKNRCASSTAIFLPNGIEQMTAFRRALSNSRTLHNIKVLKETEELVVPAPIKIYRSIEAELELQELFDRRELPLRSENMSQVQVLKKLPQVSAHGDMDSRLITLNSPQMSLYPNWTAQEGWHLGLENMIERMHQYLRRKTSTEKLAHVESVFPFSKALDAHRVMDSGDYHGKLVISMEELEKEESNTKILYRQLGRLAEFALPSSSLVSMLPLDQRLPHSVQKDQTISNNQ